MHLVADHIRSKYPLVDQLISNIKKIFRKVPSRVDKFKELYPEILLPPSPVLTRWGTLLDACKYFASNLISVENVIKNLDDDAEAIYRVNELLQKHRDKIFEELCNLKKYYTFLGESFTRFEADCVPMESSLKELSEVIQKISLCTKKSVKEKLAVVLEDNPGLTQLNALGHIKMETLKKYDIFKEMTPANLAYFKYAPLTW